MKSLNSSTSIIDLNAGKWKTEELNGSDEKEDHSLDHVIGSATNIKHLWSEVRYKLMSGHASMTSIVLEQSCSFLSSIVSGMKPHYT